MEIATLILIAASVAIVAAALWLVTRQADLAGRFKQMAEADAAAQAQLGERLQAQERALSKTLDERLTDLGKRLGDSLHQTAAKSAETIGDLKTRLAVIDAAQKNITELSAQVVGLQDILANKQARGAFGEVQLADLVQNALPPSAYRFQVGLSNGRRVDCLLDLPNPPGAIAIDAKFPLESYRAFRAAPDEAARNLAGRAFAADVLTHVRAIAERYIVPGETADSALMFLPSEAVYAELHASFPDTVEKSYRSRVWIVSPTTLMATLNTVRAVLQDVRMREQAGVILVEVQNMLEDVRRLDDRVDKLQRHFTQATGDLRDIRISTEKVTRRAEAIVHVEIDAVPPEAAPAALVGTVELLQPDPPQEVPP